MKIRRIYRFICILIITLIGIFYMNMSVAQPNSFFQSSFDGNIRYRFEKWNNMNTKYYGSNPETGKPNDNILLQRIIAGTTICFKKNISVSAHLQDSRAIGWSLRNAKEPDAFKIHAENSIEPYYIMNPQEEFLEIYDANIRIDSIFDFFTLIAGRQKIAFTDYRVFGPGSWGNTGRWNWDAVLVSFQKERWSSAIWYGGTKIHDPQKTYLPFTHTEYMGGGIHANVRISDFIQSDLYIAHKQQGSAAYIKEKMINRNWMGFRIYNPEIFPWKYEVSYTKEFGSENSSKINAYGLFLKAGYQIEEMPWKPCINLRYTRASGNKPDTGYNEQFDPVFGAADRYYGWMNLVKWSNLDDREIVLELYPAREMWIELKYNILKIPQPSDALINGNLYLPEGENHTGNEIDLFAKYSLNEKWQFVALISYFSIKKGITTDSLQPGNALYLAFQAQYTFNMKII